MVISKDGVGVLIISFEEKSKNFRLVGNILYFSHSGITYNIRLEQVFSEWKLLGRFEELNN